MLKIQNLTFGYKRSKPVLQSFDLNVSQPGVYGLLGPNGAGKTTLLQLIAGALTPSEGSVTLDGFNTRKRIPAVSGAIMSVPEELSLPAMKLADYARLYGALYPNFSNDVLQHCLERFGMPKNLSLNALSMGQKKKVFISFALACNTPILLMDEPTNGLDIQAKAVFRSLLSEHASDERIIIISTHQVHDVENLLDHLIIMDSQRVLVYASMYDLQNALYFAHNIAPEEATDALNSVPTPGGCDAMFAADPATNVPTEVNLELVFDFTLSHPDRLRSLLNLPPLPPLKK